MLGNGWEMVRNGGESGKELWGMVGNGGKWWEMMGKGGQGF